MENINWNYPTTIWFGVDRIVEIQKACEELNIQKPLIVTDNGILKTNIINIFGLKTIMREYLCWTAKWTLYRNSN